jgi:hypothetical protein
MPSVKSLYLWILFVAIALRFWAFFTIELLPVSDFKKYFDLAQNFSEFGTLSLYGQIFSFQPPLYPWLLGAIFYLFGATLFVAKCTNLVFSCLAAIIYYELINKIFGISRAGFLALALFLLFPPLALYLQVLGAETLAILIICSLMYFLQMKLTFFVQIAIGVLFFALNITRPQYAIISILIIAYFLFKEKKGGVMALAFVMLTSSYIYRNYLAYDGFVPLSSNSGYVLLVNNNEQNKLSGWMPLTKIGLTEEEKGLINLHSSIDLFSNLDEDYKTLFWTPASDKIARDLAIRWIANNGGEFVNLAWLRFSRSFFRVSEEVLGWVYYAKKIPDYMLAVSNFILIICYLGSFVGLLKLNLIKENKTLMLVLPLFVFFNIFSAIVFEGQGRYYLPIHPVLCVLVGVGLCSINMPKRGGD